METTPRGSAELLTIFGRTNGHLLTKETAHEAVNGLAEVARDIIATATGAGVSLMDQTGQRVSVGATDDSVLAADDLQYELDEGPCISAWATGKPVYVGDTRVDPRWPGWTSAAAEGGVRSCLSVPLLHTRTGLGALKVYSDRVDAFTDEHRRLLVNLARSAAVLLGHIQASDLPQRISSDVKASLAERDTIGVARGILMERHNIDRQTAMNHLIALATDEGTTIAVQADIISERRNGTSPAAQR